MERRTVTSAAREAGATIAAMLLALGVTAVVAALLALAVAMIVALTLMLVTGLPLTNSRSPAGRSSCSNRRVRCRLDGRSRGYHSSGKPRQNPKILLHEPTRRERARSSNT